jgi:hypothetical protein
MGEDMTYGGLATPTYKKDFVVKGNPGHITHEKIKETFAENTDPRVVDVIKT